MRFNDFRQALVGQRVALESEGVLGLGVGRQHAVDGIADVRCRLLPIQYRLALHRRNRCLPQFDLLAPRHAYQSATYRDRWNSTVVFLGVNLAIWKPIHPCMRRFIETMSLST